MSGDLRVDLERGLQSGTLEMLRPNGLVDAYCVWWCVDTNHQRIVKMSPNEVRTRRFFDRRVARLTRQGWELKGGGSGND